jgi:hypothetical protein
MSKSEFFLAVERGLQLRHVPFDAVELRTFLANCWPLIEPGESPERWAEAFLESRQTPA